MSGLVSPNALKRALLNEYSSFSNKAIKRIEMGKLFIVDDRSPGDVGADKRLFGWFCTIFAEVRGAEDVQVTIGSEVPKSPSVLAWITAHADSSDGRGIVFNATPLNVTELLNLSSSIRAITQKKYEVKAYKYVCPRTANALDRLARTLANHWGTTASKG